MTEDIIQFDHITQEFPGVLALDDVTVSIRRGGVHALVGENGAGKSTLVKLAGGVYQPTGGRVIYQGQPISIPTPYAARKLGIGIVHQEFPLCAELTVAGNMYLGNERKVGPGLLDWKTMNARAAEVLTSLGVEVDPRTPVGRLNVGQQQMVEIARSLLFESQIIFMDEPTSALTSKEGDQLFRVIRRLVERGITIVYVSHKMEEIFALSDTISVLRDGKHVGTLDRAAASEDIVISMMVGRVIHDLFPERQFIHDPDAAPVLAVNDLNNGALRDISFTVQRGEILGVAGIHGCGSTELLRALFGADAVESGQIVLEGKRLKLATPADAIAAGIAYVPADRRLEGLNMIAEIQENIATVTLRQLATALGVVPPGRIRRLGEELKNRLSIRARDVHQEVSELSGGNQQKVVLAKWLTRHPKILLMDDPTRGVDVGSKAEIHSLMHRLAESGVTILFISSELPELLGMCDRVLVMFQGRVSGELSRAAATETAVMMLATGSVA